MTKDNIQNSDELHVNELLKEFLSRDRYEQLQYLNNSKMRRLENLQDQNQNVSDHIIKLLQLKNNEYSVDPEEISNLTNEDKFELTKVLKDRQKLRCKREQVSYDYEESQRSSVISSKFRCICGMVLSGIMIAIPVLPFLPYIGYALITICFVAYCSNSQTEDDIDEAKEILDYRTNQYNQDKPKFQEIETKLKKIVAADKSVYVSQQNLPKAPLKRKRSTDLTL